MVQRNKNIAALMIGIAFAICSCNTTNTIDPLTYIKTVEDKESGLKIEKKIDDFSFSLLYKPAQYISLVENQGQIVSKEQFDNRVKELDQMQYYTLQITSSKSNELLKAGIQNETEYFKRLEYFMSYMQDDIVLLDGNDTLNCALFHFERNYGIAPYSNFLLGFENRGKNLYEDKTLIYDDKIFGTGKINLTIKSSDISGLPKIKMPA